jgi:hypothetical protein
MLDVVGDHDGSSDGVDEGSTDVVGDHDGSSDGFNDNDGVDEGRDESVGSIVNDGVDEGRDEGETVGDSVGHPLPNKSEDSLPLKPPPSSRSWPSYEIL